MSNIKILQFHEYLKEDQRDLLIVEVKSYSQSEIDGVILNSEPHFRPNSTQMGITTEVAQNLAKKQIPFCLVLQSDITIEIYQMARLDKLITICRSVDEAKAIIEEQIRG